MTATQDKLPVALIVYNRPHFTKAVLKKIFDYRPPKLFVIADGPKNNKDKKLCNEVRDLIDSFNWECSIQKIYSNNNMGLKKRVISGLNEVFERSVSAIILEDDCLPSDDFFIFCNEMINRYENEERVGLVTGVNFQDGILRGSGSYYFSKYNHCWGWATWSRSWDYFSESIDFWPEFKRSPDWKRNFNSFRERQFWTKHFDYTFKNNSNSWAANWTLSVWYKKLLTVTPQYNLVSNIGFGDDSTHTNDSNSRYANMDIEKLGKIKFLENIECNIDADIYTFENHFQGYKLKLRNRILRIFKKIIKRQ